MRECGVSETTRESRRFFISRQGDDAAFAIRVAEALRQAGAETILQDEDFGHQNFMDAMDAGLRDANARVLALVSPEYLASDYCRIEATAALGGDAMNRKGRLIPILIAHCRPDGVLTSIPYVSVAHERQIGEDAEAVRKILGACGFGAKPTPRQVRRGAIMDGVARPARVIGREALLKTIAARLWDGAEAAPILALTGVGGVGKSTLAREYAWRERARYQGASLIVASGRDALTEGLIRIGARVMEGLEREQDRAAAASKALRWLETSGAETPWLLILDNVNDPADLSGLLPRENVHIVATSRRDDWRDPGLAFAATPLDVDVLAPEDAVRYLCTTAGREDHAGAAALSEALGRLPLALEQAASFCLNNRMVDFGGYLAKAEEYLARPYGAEENRSVAATFALAINEVAARDPESVRLLELMSFCAPSAIPLDLFVTDERDAETVGAEAAELARWSLIQQAALKDGTPGANVHRLVQASARARAEAERIEETLALLRAALRLGDGADSPQDHRAWPRLARLEPHGLAALGHMATRPQETSASTAAVIANALGVVATAQARLAVAEALYRRALAILEPALGPDHPHVAALLHNLAATLQERGASAEAETLQSRALTIREAALGPTHPEVAKTLSNLALMLQARGAHGEAEPLQQRALDIREAAYGPEHPDVANSLNNLAESLRIRDDAAAAEPLYRRALDITETTLGPNHPMAATALNNLALALQMRGAFDAAEPLHRRALAIREAALGPEHPDVATSLSNQAALLFECGRSDEAEPLLRRALAIFEAALPAEHPQIGVIRDTLAEMRRALAHPERREAAAAQSASEPPSPEPAPQEPALQDPAPQEPEPQAESPAPAAEAPAPAAASSASQTAPEQKRRGFFGRLFGRDRAS